MRFRSMNPSVTLLLVHRLTVTKPVSRLPVCLSLSLHTVCLSDCFSLSAFCTVTPRDEALLIYCITYTSSQILLILFLSSVEFKAM